MIEMIEIIIPSLERLILRCRTISEVEYGMARSYMFVCVCVDTINEDTKGS